MIDDLPEVHPGAILRDELEAAGRSARSLARELGVPANVVSDIVRGRRSVTPRTAIRLGRAFGTTDLYWMNLQVIYDLKRARSADR